MVYIKEGKGVFSLGKKSWVIEQGGLFWVPPGIVCSMESRSRTMVCPFIHFDLIYRNPGSHWEMHIPEGVTDISAWNHLMHPRLPAASAFSKLAGVYQITQGEYICGLIEDICRDAAMMRPSFKAEQSGRMLLLLSALLREVLNEGSLGQDLTARLLKLPGYLKDHLAEASVFSCASFCALSESYFRKVFPQIYGTSPRNYLVRMRMRRAADMLAHTAISLEQISMNCGYSSTGNFSRVFSRTMGIPPGRYRRGMES